VNEPIWSLVPDLDSTRGGRAECGCCCQQCQAEAYVAVLVARIKLFGRLPHVPRRLANEGSLSCTSDVLAGVVGSSGLHVTFVDLSLQKLMLRTYSLRLEH